MPHPGMGPAVICSFIWKVAHPVSDRTQQCLTSVKLMELAGPLGHSPRWCREVALVEQILITFNSYFSHFLRTKSCNFAFESNCKKLWCCLVFNLFFHLIFSYGLLQARVGG